MGINATTSDTTSAAAPAGRNRRSIRAALVTVAAAATLVALTGCAGGSSSATPAGSAGTGGSASKSSSASGSSSSKAPYTDAEACAWLKKNLPTVPDTEIGAQAQLTIGLSSFFEDHGGLEHADGYEIDDAFSRGCPALRTAALKKAGIKTFGNL
jgi:hypothetical protein